MSDTQTTLIRPKEVLEELDVYQGMRVADFGCGRTGYFLFPLAKLIGEQGIVYAIDIVKEVLESIKRRANYEGLDNIQSIWSDIERVGKTPIPSESLDMVFFVNVLFQLKNREDAIQESIRLLKKNGLLVIIDWKKNLGPLGPKDGMTVTVEDIQTWANDLKLQILKTKELSEYTYLTILKKIE